MYHVTVPAPQVKGTDALFQEIDALCDRFGGTINYLNPSRTPGRFQLKYFGCHNLPLVLLKEVKICCHHVFGSELYPCPVFRIYRKPILYSVICSVRQQEKPTYDLNARFAHIIVTNKRDRQIVANWGTDRVSVVRPGIDIARFSYYAPVEDGTFSILVASAPWVEEQFQTKGFEALFQAAAQIPELRLFLLWRGFLNEELHKRLAHYNLVNRTTVIDEYTDVNSLLGQVHATFVLASSALEVKSYPHSLMESIAAGKPVGVSSCIAMADDVREHQLGVVISELQAETVKKSILELLSNYHGYQQNTRRFDKTFFSMEEMLNAYQRIYNKYYRK